MPLPGNLKHGNKTAKNEGNKPTNIRPRQTNLPSEY